MNFPFWRVFLIVGGFGALMVAILIPGPGLPLIGKVLAEGQGWWPHWNNSKTSPTASPGPVGHEWEGTWYWIRSPDEEKRVIGSLYTRYCIRCHGVDGRGVWDMPEIPNFTNPHWQESRSDGQLACLILEGRGALMPPFRGTLTLEEAWGLARYLRTFISSPENNGQELLKKEMTPSRQPLEVAPQPRQALKPVPSLEQTKGPVIGSISPWPSALLLQNPVRRNY